MYTVNETIIQSIWKGAESVDVLRGEEHAGTHPNRKRRSKDDLLV